MSSSENQPIFVHIAKTAGKSVKRYFKYNLFRAGVMDAPFIERSYWNDRFSFTFVRNPYDRLVSTYFYIVNDVVKEEKIWRAFWWQIVKRGGDRRGSPTVEGFRRFVESYFGQFPNPGPITGDMRYLDHQMLFPQSYWFPSHLPYSFIGRFENFQNDLLEVKRLTNLDTEEEIPNVNRSPRDKGWRQYYTARTTKLVSDFYHEDMERFGYDYADID